MEPTNKTVILNEKAIMEGGNTVARHERHKHSAFMEAAGMVLSVGFTVLGGIGRAIKATTRLLINTRQISKKPQGTVTMGTTDTVQADKPQSI